MGNILALPLTYAFSWFGRKETQTLSTATQHQSSIISRLWQLALYCWIKYSQGKKVKRVCCHENDPSKGPEVFGFIPSRNDWKNERPRKFKATDKNIKDEVFFEGGNKDGYFVSVSITKLSDTIAEVRALLRLPEASYQLPCHPSTAVYTYDSDTFSAAGLTLRCLCPLERWRVAFCGLMRQVSGEGSTSDDNFGVPVKFSFTWTIVGGVYDLQTQTHPLLLAESIARDGYFGSSTKIKQIEERLNRYEQWGQYSGILSVEGQPEKELYLWGPKARDRGVIDWNSCDCNIRIYCYMEDGFVFNVGTLSAPGIVSHLQYGYVAMPNRKIFSIHHCDNILPWVEEGALPDYFTFTFQAGLETFIVEVTQLQDRCETFHGKDWEARSVQRVAEFVIEERRGFGVIDYTYRNPVDMKTLVTRLPPPLLNKEVDIPENIPWVISFKEPLCQNSKITGGKGSSLAALTEISASKQAKDTNFSVPQGLVVTTTAYQRHLEMNNNLKAAVHTLDISADKKLDELKSICERVMSEFCNTPLHPNLKAELVTKLQEVFPGDLSTYRFAVRSSAIGEDSAETSAAGQLDTFLGVRGLKQISESIAKCWASQFSFTAVQYHRQTGQSITSGMGVVIQEMVPCEVAGVMFTCDPSTGNPGLISITANYGLGESVVSAAADPDTVTLKRSLDDQVFFHTQAIGTKTVCIRMDDNEGTIEDKPPTQDSQQCCLTQEQAINLGRIGVLIERDFLSVIDIEWGIINGLIYILQARPVTTQNLESDFEIKHEFDSGLLTDFEYSSKANTGEVMPGAFTPLTISVVVKHMNTSIMAANMKNEEKKNISYFPMAVQFLTTTHQHVLLNLLDIVFRKNDKKMSAMSRSWEIGMFGRFLDDVPDIRKAGIHRYGYTEGSILHLLPFIVTAFRIKSMLKSTEKKVASYSIPYDQFQSSISLFNEITGRLTDTLEAIMAHFGSSGLSSLYTGIIFGNLLKGNEATEEVFSIFGQLLSDCKDVESADVPAALKNIALVVCQNGNGEEFVQMEPEQALKWLQEDKGAVGECFRTFLKRHGHRCLKEFDLSSVTWGTDPCKLVKCIQTMVKNPSLKQAKRVDSVNISEVLERLPVQPSKTSRYLLGYLISLAKSAVGHREKSKSLYVKQLDAFRKAYCHLAKLMVKEWRLPDENLIFFLSHEEIGELLYTRSAHLLSKAVRRRRVHEELNKLRFPEIVCGVPKPIQDSEEIAIDPSSTSCIKATPVCKGVIKGTARVALNLEEAALIQPKDILITYSTDIGWTPYFPLLTGVVTELGGLISHGAVIAREYGLPCIVGAQHATRLFKSGDTVILDGTQGILQKVNDEGDEKTTS